MTKGINKGEVGIYVTPDTQIIELYSEGIFCISSEGDGKSSSLPELYETFGSW